MSPAWIPLPDAARQLGVSWAVAWRFVLQGHIRAEKAANGRWYVDAMSLEAYQARQRRIEEAEAEEAGDAVGHD